MTRNFHLQDQPRRSITNLQLSLDSPVKIGRQLFNAHSDVRFTKEVGSASNLEAAARLSTNFQRFNLAAETRFRRNFLAHGVGATDTQIARLFQRKIALDALVGALAGAAIAAIALLIVGGGGAALAREVAGTSPLQTADLILLALMPLAAALLATLVARAAVLSALRKAP